MEFRAVLASRESCWTHELHTAQYFIAANPWKTSDELVRFAAILRGACVMTMGTYIAGAGVALKYKPAMSVN